MARMIPPSIPVAAPKGERLLFAKLRDDPKTREWVVFHSFDIRRHVARHEGEADMLIVAPGYGVLCLEIKGCDVSRLDGMWIYPYGTSPIGPFRQASDAAHSIRKYIGQKDSSLSGLMFHSAVVLTEIDFEEKSLEWHPWQVIGRTNLLRMPISSLIEGVFDRARNHYRIHNATYSWFENQSSRPSVKQVNSIANLLRGDFEYTGSAQYGVEIAEASIRRYTEEQFVAIDNLADNPRILFKGPAGTGKTFLAIEAARRSVRERKRTALLCFNSLLGEWMKSETEDIAVEAKNLGVDFYVGTLPSLMLSIARIHIPISFDRHFWQNVLPTQTIDALLSDKKDFPIFDMLIVDEAQDLLSELNLDVMSLLLESGLNGGHWAIFGDFERQAIFSEYTGESGLNLLRQRAGDSVCTLGLRINCRNSLRIAEAVTITAGMSPGYSRVLQSIEASDVEPVFYRKVGDQAHALQLVVRKLLLTFSPSQIVILSTRTDSESCAAKIQEGVDELPFTPYKHAGTGSSSIRFASIHAFKGLESAAIVLTDVEHIEDEQAKALLYVGMSRARVQLFILMNDRVRPTYDALLDAGLKAVLRKISQ
jgi:DNA polymerase III delta prime subunit